MDTLPESLKIFLSGSVKKGESDQRANEFFWSEKDELLLKNTLGENIEILNPNTIKIPKYQYHERFAADIEMLLKSDVVIVDARTKKGLGVGAEMALAKQNHIPVFTLCPFGSEYRGWIEIDGAKREWIHPFVSELSDKVFESLEEIVEEIRLIKKA